MQDDYDLAEYLPATEAQETGGLSHKIAKLAENRFFVPTVVVLVAVIAFCLGRLSKIEENRPGVRVLNNSSPNPSLNLREGGSALAGTSEIKEVSTPSELAQVVASKNGTKYHYPWCAGAKQISEKNKITFASIEAARAAGYTPASNCKGLK